jgi:hypothetical protein
MKKSELWANDDVFLNQGNSMTNNVITNNTATDRRRGSFLFLFLFGLHPKGVSRQFLGGG